jgi:hypothetical protein
VKVEVIHASAITLLSRCTSVSPSSSARHLPIVTLPLRTEAVEGSCRFLTFGVFGEFFVIFKLLCMPGGNYKEMHQQSFYAEVIETIIEAIEFLWVRSDTCAG